MRRAPRSVASVVSQVSQATPSSTAVRSVRVKITADPAWQIRWRHYYAVMDAAAAKLWPKHTSMAITKPVSSAPAAERQTFKRRVHHSAECALSLSVKHFTPLTAFPPGAPPRNGHTPAFAQRVPAANFKSGFYAMPGNKCKLEDGSPMHTGHAPGHDASSIRQSSFPPTISDEDAVNMQRSKTHDGVSIPSLLSKLASEGRHMTAGELRVRLKGRGEDLLEATKEVIEDPVFDLMHRQDERDLLRDVWRIQDCHTLTR